MRRMAGIGALLLAIASFALGQSAKPGPGSDSERAIEQLLEEYREAILKNNVSALDRLLAADFTITFPSGVAANKAQTLAQAAANQFEFIIWEDIKVRVYGNTAVVAFQGTRKAKAMAPEGFRALAVCVKQNGQWKVVAQQGTRITG